MSRVRPYIIVVGIDLVLFGTIIAFAVVPMFRQVIDQRTTLDDARTNIESLRAERSKIASLSTTFTTLQNHQEFIGSLFLNDQRIIEYFNLLDALGAELSLSQLDYKINTPAKNESYQVLGIHISFTSSFANAVNALKKLYTLPIGFRIDSLMLSETSTGATVSVSIDGSVSWSRQ